MRSPSGLFAVWQTSFRLSRFGRFVRDSHVTVARIFWPAGTTCVNPLAKFSQWQRDKQRLEVLIEIKPEATQLIYVRSCRASTHSVDANDWIPSNWHFLWRADLFTCMRGVFTFFCCRSSSQLVPFFAQLTHTHTHIPGDMAVWEVAPPPPPLPSCLIYARPHADVLRQNPHNQIWNISVLRDLATGSRLAFASAGCHEPPTSWERLVPNSAQYARVPQTNCLFFFFSFVNAMYAFPSGRRGWVGRWGRDNLHVIVAVTSKALFESLTTSWLTSKCRVGGGVVIFFFMSKRNKSAANSVRKGHGKH